MIRRPRIQADRDIRRPALAHDLAVQRLGRAGRVEEVDPVVRRVRSRLVAAGRRPVRPPRQSRFGDRVRVDLPPRVPEPGRLDRPADRPVHRQPDVRSESDRLVRPVQVRRSVEVAQQEDRHPARSQSRRRPASDALHPRQADPPLQRVDLVRSSALPASVGPYGSAGGCTLAIATTAPGRTSTNTRPGVDVRRIQDRITRDDLRPSGREPPPEGRRDPGRVALRLLQRDDVRVRQADGLDHLGEVDAGPALLDIEDHDAEGQGIESASPSAESSDATTPPTSTESRIASRSRRVSRSCGTVPPMTTLTRRLVRLLAAAALAFATILPSVAPTAAATDKVLRVGTAADLDSMNPWNTALSIGFEVFTLNYDMLVNFGQDLQPVPGFAESWSRKDEADGTFTWTFKIHEGMKWSDGKPATAEDARWTYPVRPGWHRVAGLRRRRLHRP